MHVFGIFFEYFTFFWDKEHKLQEVIFSRILKMAESATVMWPKNMECTMQFCEQFGFWEKICFIRMHKSSVILA